MTRKVRPDALARVVAETYAKSANAEMTNQDLFEGLADAGVVPREALRKMTPVGKSGAKHCLAQRQLRWAQQNLARAQLLERDPKKRGVWRLTTEGKQQFVRPAPRRVLLGFSTDLGLALWGTAQDVFSNWDEPIVLALSSPPYPLAKQRAYGNPALAQYVDFVVGLVEPIVRNLAYGGSIVLNLSQDCFEEGSPARSTVLERTLIALEDRLGLRIIDRIPWVNASKPPGPTRYASITRTHLNVAWEPVYWLSPHPHALRSDNRRVLLEHTQRHLDLIHGGGEKRARSNSDGAYTLRPGRSFARVTEGRIQRNVLEMGHACTGQQAYKKRAREMGLPAHGAPFPEALARFFVKFMTEPGDLCADFCAGSQTMPVVCEELGRRWVSAEVMGEFIRGGAERLRHAPGFMLHDDLLDGLRLKHLHPTMEGQTSLDI